MQTGGHRASIAATGAALHLCLVAPAALASTVESVDSEPGSNPDIVVTGTQLDIDTVRDTPVVITEFERDDLALQPTLADTLRQQPMVVPGGGPAAGGGSQGGQNFINLRGLGNNRTLVLVDGRRYIPAGPNGLTDVNLIPEAIVSRVNVVTGGASAAYGSDALAGVVDIRLDTAFSGVRFDARTGISQRGDNAEEKVSLAAGFGALDGRLRIVVSGEHYENRGVGGGDRAFRRKAGNQIRNPAGSPSLVRAEDVRTPYTLGGLVVIGEGGTAAGNALVSGLKFEPSGGTSAYDYGRFSTTRLTANGTQDGGDGFRASTGQDVIRPQRRDLVFGHARFAATDDLEIAFEASRSDTGTVFSNSPNLATLSIRRNNPFLAARAPDLLDRINAAGVTGFTLNRLILEQGPTLSRFDFKAGHKRIGANLSFLGLEWRTSFQHARNAYDNTVANNLIPANLTRAVNAVTGPAGTPVCADLLSSDPAKVAAADGCVAFDPFGYGAPSAAALAYVTGTARARGVTTMYSFDASVAGKLGGFTSEPVEFAAGVNWRRLKSSTVADERSVAGGWRIGNPTNFEGRNSVREAFGEALVPLLSGTAAARRLDVNLAARIIDYSNSGSVLTWKAGLNWRPSETLRFHLTRSRDIRAPNLEELFAAGRQGKATIVDSLTGQTYNNIPVKNLGNEELRPEEANTWVAGFEFEPRPSLRFSVDYYSVRISDAIRVLAAAQTVEQCNISGQTSPICAWVTRDPVTNAITGARVSPVNLSSQRAQGVDMEMRWRAPDGWSFLGNGDEAGLRLIASYAIKNEIRSPLIANPVDDAGNLIAQSAPSGSAISSLPRLRVNADVNLRRGAWGLHLLGRYISAFTWDKTRTLGIDTDFNRIRAQFYLDSEISVRPDAADDRMELYLTVRNLLDHDPPYSPVPGNSTPLPSQPVLYDQVGRMFTFGVRLAL